MLSGEQLCRRSMVYQSSILVSSLLYESLLISDTFLEDSPQMQDLLVEFIIPTSLSASSQQIVNLISSPTLLLSTPLTPPVTPKPHIAATDIIKKGRLPEEGRFRVCTKCGERNVRSGAANGLGVETGKWAAFEMGWDVRCCCGGLWAFASIGSV